MKRAIGEIFSQDDLPDGGWRVPSDLKKTNY